MICCWVCRRDIPEALQNQHHVRPQAAGGGPQDLVRLCSGCHHNLHRIQDMLSGPRAAEARSTAEVYYHDAPSAAQRCVGLALRCVEHMALHQSQPRDPTEAQEILCSVPAIIKSRLMQMGRETTDPQTGRRLGLAGVVRGLLTAEVLRRYPTVRRELRRSIDRSPESIQSVGPQIDRSTKRSKQPRTRAEVQHVETPEPDGPETDQREPDG